jgi:hypothetical protein
MSKKHVLTLLLVFIAVSVVFRCAAAVYQGNEVVDTPGAADQISYHNLALSILEGKGFSFATNWWPATAGGAPTAHWSYLYTFYLVIVYSVFGESPFSCPPDPGHCSRSFATFINLLSNYPIIWGRGRACRSRFNCLLHIFHLLWRNSDDRTILHDYNTAELTSSRYLGG